MSPTRHDRSRLLNPTPRFAWCEVIERTCLWHINQIKTSPTNQTEPLSTQINQEGLTQNIKHDSPHRAGRVGHGQKPEQRLPKSRTKWDETQGGARSDSGAFAFREEGTPRLETPHLERLWGGRCFWPRSFCYFSIDGKSNKKNIIFAL